MENKGPEGVAAIFAHQEFYGVKMGAIESKIGDKWDEKNPVVISGHIHQWQRLQSNIFYTGTPRQIGFGDKTKKSISEFIFTLDDNKTELNSKRDLEGNKDGVPRVKSETEKKEDVKNEVKNGVSYKVEEKRHFLKVIEKHTVHLDVKQASSYVPPENSIIKLIISGSAAELHVFKQHSAARLESLKIKVQYKVIEVKDGKHHSVSTDSIEKTYSQLLYDSIKGKDELRIAFEELFNPSR
jgi:hypothetical protein